MKTDQLVVAALLLTCLASEAAAAEESGPKSKRAQKVLATLNALGLNDQDVQAFVAATDERIHDKHFYFHEFKTESGTLSLRHRLKTPSLRHLELRYTPNETPVEFSAKPRIVMVRYHREF